MKLSDIELTGLNVLRDGEFEQLAQCTIQLPKRNLSFLSEDKYIGKIMENDNITCVICKNEHTKFFQSTNHCILVSENPKLTFFRIHNLLAISDRNEKTIIDPSSSVSDSAIISTINVCIGENVIIEDNVVIKENVSIGDNTIIRSGCIIGGQGYEFKRNEDKDILRVKHLGKVIIGTNVELKEYVTVHKAVFEWDKTSIGDYCKLDAHTHIGHASKIGERVLLGSHSNIAGNVEIGNDVYIGPGVTISNRLIIEDKSKISIGSVVTKDVKRDSTVTGNFAIPHNVFISNLKRIVQND